LAAAHAADGLQALLEVIGAGQNIEAADVDALGGQLRDAHQSLTNAVTNVDILRGIAGRCPIVGSAGGFRGRTD